MGDVLKTAHTATGELRQGATTYINRLSEFMASSTHSIDDFVIARDGLIDYLQGFYRERHLTLSATSYSSSPPRCGMSDVQCARSS